MSTTTDATTEDIFTMELSDRQRANILKEDLDYALEESATLQQELEEQRVVSKKLGAMLEKLKASIVRNAEYSPDAVLSATSRSTPRVAYTPSCRYHNRRIYRTETESPRVRDNSKKAPPPSRPTKRLLRVAIPETSRVVSLVDYDLSDCSTSNTSVSAILFE